VDASVDSCRGDLVALAGLGEKDRATEWIERARAMAPDDPVVLEYAAAVHARAGRMAAALACGTP
jgi:hypothetical protein